FKPSLELARQFDHARKSRCHSERSEEAGLRNSNRENLQRLRADSAGIFSDGILNPSICFLTSLAKAAAPAPFTTRWSNVSESVITSALSFLFLLGINSRWAVPTNSVPTEGGTTIGAPALTPNAPRLVITTGAFMASTRPPRVEATASS